MRFKRLCFAVHVCIFIGLSAAGCEERQWDEYNSYSNSAAQVSNVHSEIADETSEQKDWIGTECDNAAACAAWGDQIADELEARYGSFVEMQPVELSAEEEERSDEDEEIIAEYQTEGNDFIVNRESKDAAGHEQLWNDFRWLFPLEEREMVTAFSVFSHVDTLAHVVQNEDNLQEWSLAMNIDPDMMTPEEKVATLVHEFGHLHTLNSAQVDPFAERKSCTTLFLDEGCASKDAYIYAFQTRFWPEPEYDYNEKQFVSEYAAMDFVEDIAESWMHFVLTEEPGGTTVAEQKVLFFYKYDELVRLRAELLARAASWMERYGV